MENNYDIIIIGAGLHSLSLLTRIQDASNSVDEHQFNVLGNKLPFQNSCFSCLINSVDKNLPLKIAVIDSNNWCTNWKNNFKTLNIKYLRSTVTVHPNPVDNDGLLEFINSKDNPSDLTLDIFNHIKTNKRKKKSTLHVFNEVDRKYFCLPKSSTFEEYIDHLVEKYNLNQYLIQDKVTKISYSYSENDELSFTLSLLEGKDIKANKVIYAANIQKPNIPKQCLPYYPKDISKNNENIPEILHSKDTELLSKVLHKENQKILIIGGGLSAAHCALLANKLKNKVTLIARNYLKVQQFETPVEWMSRNRNFELNQFYSSSLQKRYEMIKTKRNGGTITPQIYTELRSKNISIKEKYILCNIEANDNISWMVKICNIDNPNIIESNIYDVIILATGTQPNIHDDYLLSPLQSSLNLPTFNNYPILNDNLSWGNIPLYIMGIYSSLEIGPEGSNLNGGRICTSRIINELINDDSDSEIECSHEEEVICTTNRFASLLQLN